jgi:hypothetical protein
MHTVLTKSLLSSVVVSSVLVVAGMQPGYFSLLSNFQVRDIANQGFAIFPVKVRKYIIKAFAMQKILHHSYFIW